LVGGRKILKEGKVGIFVFVKYTTGLGCRGKRERKHCPYGKLALYFSESEVLSTLRPSRGKKKKKKKKKKKFKKNI
jgi:hypothetical protein